MTELPEGWRHTTLGAICERGGGEIQTGPFGSQLHASDYVEVGIPVVMPQDLRGNEVDIAEIAQVSEGTRDALGRHRLLADDIVSARRGDLRRRALVGTREEGWLCGTGCLRVRVGGGADSAFVFHSLGHPLTQDWIDRHAVGATMPNLNTGILAACPILLPPPSEQRRIASVLSLLDNRIAAEKRVAGSSHRLLTEAFGRAIDTSAPTEDGDETLATIASFINGGAFTKGASGTGRPVLRIRELNAGGVDATTIRSDRDVAEHHLARDGDLLFSWSGTLDTFRWYGPASIINQHIFKVTPTTRPLWEVELWIDHHLKRFRRIASDKAVTMGHIRRGDLAEAKVLRFSAESRAMLDAIGAPLESRRDSARREVQCLTSIRDMLLPRLVSGAIRVPASAGDVEALEALVDGIALAAHQASDPATGTAASNVVSAA